jgi:hypothetical protein
MAKNDRLPISMPSSANPRAASITGSRTAGMDMDGAPSLRAMTSEWDDDDLDHSLDDWEGEEFREGLEPPLTPPSKRELS